jgi:hypothetical protein
MSMFVLLGLKDTQSRIEVSEIPTRFRGVLTISVVDMRILDHNVRTSVRIPPVSILRSVGALASTRNVDIVEDDIR